MSRISGVVYFDGRPADPAAHAHDSPRIYFDGRLDNREELIDACDDVIVDDRGVVSDPVLVLAAYRRFGVECAGRMTGDFAFALVDPGERRLLLARDLMAARPLFYCTVHGGVVFASDMKSLLARHDVQARPDEDGLADLVLNGYYDGARTWLDGIRSVPPGAIVVASQGRLTVTRVSEFDAADIRYASWSQYAEHFGVLFTQAVRRRLRSEHPVAVSVSGGVDSSSIYCEAARLGVAPVQGFTLAFPHGTPLDEHQFIGALRSRALRVDDIAVGDVRLVTDTERSVARTEMPRLPWECQDDLLARARDAGCRVLLEGFFADQVLAGQSYLVDLARAGRWMAVGQHLREWPAWMTDVDRGVFPRRFATSVARAIAPSWLMVAAKRTIGRARASRRYAPWFTASFRERAHQQAIDRARTGRRFRSEHREQSWRNLTTGNYFASLLQTHNAASAFQIDVTYPFRDRDLVTFLAAVPGDIVSHQGVPKALLRHATSGVVPDAIRLRRWKADGTLFSNRASQLALRVLSTAMGRRPLAAAAGFLDVDVLRSHLDGSVRDALSSRDSAHPGWQVADTLALELWMQRFCGEGVAAYA